MRHSFPLFFACLMPSLADAARPMITDDARLTDAGACQVETWAHMGRDHREFWALPACNPGGNFELTVGGAIAQADGYRENSARVIQGKILFKPLETNGYGIGLAVGQARQPGNSGSGTPYFYVPASASLADDRLVIHTNLGYTSQGDEGVTRLTWGVGSEWQLGGRSWLIAESYGQDKGRPFFQFGLRHWLIPGHLQIDTTYGSQFGEAGPQHWLSVGLRLISLPLF